MPVEIKELVIRMSASGAETADSGKTAVRSSSTGSDQEALVEACVKQVLKILEKKKAR